MANHANNSLGVKNPFVEKILSECPQSGAGVHAWLFSTARQLHYHHGYGEIVEILRSATANCGRPVPVREIEAAVRDSAAVAWMPDKVSGTYTAKSPKPVPDAALIEQAISNGMSVVDLWEQSPCRVEADDPAAVLPRLFDGDPLLCLGRSANDFETKPLSEWMDDPSLSECSLIVPSPMSARYGMTQSGRPSQRSLDNVGPRRFLVCEFDRGTPDEQAAKLWWLKDYFSLVLVVWSGRKSLHGWYQADDLTETENNLFYKAAVAIGADPATKCPAQMVRLPLGLRDNGKRQGIRQGVVYFNNKNQKTNE